MICLSGSTILSIIPASTRSGLFSTTGMRLSSTSYTAWRNSFSPGFLFSTFS